MNLTWTVGDVRVTRIVELEMSSGGKFLFDEATPEAIRAIDWLHPHFAEPDGRMKMSIHALVVETPGKRIVVDTCIGNDKPRNLPAWSHMQTRFLDDMTAAGFPPESIDVVLCTHLHVDHVGWNTRLVDGAWVPTFPNARYLLGKAEFEYWKAGHEDGAADGQIFADSVQPVWDAGLVELVSPDHQVCPEVRLVPTPGHTIDHVSVGISSKGHEAIITGDFVHHPCQMAHTSWASHFDYDKSQSSRTRVRMFEDFARDRTLVIGTHFAAPTAGRVVKDGDAFRFEA